ncbi:MAG: LytTR family transcriptional regulator, partial [Prevotella sp.]|nr:LytTR family transcriptional regulator [Prevotella sp.]
KYLAAELEDTKMLNMRLKRKSEASDTLHTPTEQHLSEIVLSGTTNESVTLQITNLLYIEAVGNYVKVYHLRDGKVQNDMLRATSKQMEDDLRQYPMIVRCHRAFLVNLGQVEQIVSHSGTMQLIIKHSHESIPVSRSKMSQIKDVIKNMY